MIEFDIFDQPGTKEIAKLLGRTFAERDPPIRRTVMFRLDCRACGADSHG
jgi:hypothetical protein